MKTGNKFRKWLAVIAATAAVSGLAGIAIDSTSSVVAGAASSATATCVTQADAAVAAAEKATAAFTPTPLPKSVTKLGLKGKTAWFLAPLSVGVEQLMANGFVAAGKVSGLKTKTVDVESVSADNEAIEAAVATHPAFIVIDSIPTADVSAGLNAALTAKVPVISLFESATTPIAKKAIKELVTTPNVQQGQIEADEALALTGCQLNIGILYGLAYEAERQTAAADAEQVAKLCAACNVYEANYNADTYQTTAGTQAVSMIDDNPGLNVLVLGNDDIVQPVMAALTAASSKVQVISNVGGASTLALLKQSGSTYAANVAQGPFNVMGWFGMDQGIRAAAHLSFDSKDTLQMRLLTQANDPAPSAQFPQFNNLGAKFKKAWKG